MRYRIEKTWSSLSPYPIYEVMKNGRHIMYCKPLSIAIRAKRTLIQQDKERKKERDK